MLSQPKTCFFTVKEIVVGGSGGMLLYIHATLKSLSEPDGLPPSFPRVLAPTSSAA